jgi:protein-tyrosine phosphatase
VPRALLRDRERVIDLAWEGCLNVRDLGGMQAGNGSVVRRGALVRADNVRTLTSAGWDALVAYGIRRVVDLRLQHELDADAGGEPPVEVVHISVLGEFDGDALAFYDAKLDESTDAAAYLAWSYGDFLERYHRKFALAVEAIADAPEGGVVVHCMGGKDRTGLIAALVLRDAGVAISEIADDYAKSELNLEPRHAAWLAAAPDEAAVHRLRMLLPTPAAVMSEVLETVEARHGTVAGYLQAGGVSAEALERLRRRLLEPS